MRDAPPSVRTAEGRVARRRPAPPASTQGAQRSASERYAVGAALVALTVVSRWPLRGRTLFNWDAIQYALATDRFDLAAHRPHPPGYPGYVLAARLARALTGADANTALIGLSVLATALSVLAIEAVAYRVSGRRGGLVAAALLLLSPLAWFYSETALTYAFDPLISLAGGWFAWRAFREGSLTRLVCGCLLVSLLGAVRPTSAALLLPVLAWTAWHLGQSRRRARPAGAAAAAFTVGTALWAIPLMVISGGPQAFLHASLQLGDAVSASSAVWSTGIRGLAANSRAVLDGLLLSLGLAAPLVGAAVALWRLRPAAQRPSSPWPGPGPQFMAIWIGPALLVFAAVHIGQLGYLLFPLPALLLAATGVLDRSAELLHLPERAVARWVSLGVVLAVDLVLFAGSLAPVVRTHDRQVAAILAATRRHPAAETVVLTDPASDGSYRLGMYSMRPYRVLAVGRDRSGRTGELFANDGSAPEYDLSRFDRVGRLRLPASGNVVVLDGPVLGVIGDIAGLDDHALDGGARVWTVTLRASDPAVIWGQRIWLHGSDCPCERYRNNAPLPPRVS
ncbi:MAG: hypothetical protein ABR541_00265 [Candidatus Dormibacteria bacterium]